MQVCFGLEFNIGEFLGFAVRVDNGTNFYGVVGVLLKMSNKLIDEVLFWSSIGHQLSLMKTLTL